MLIRLEGGVRLVESVAFHVSKSVWRKIGNSVLVAQEASSNVATAPTDLREEDRLERREYHGRNNSFI